MLYNQKKVNFLVIFFLCIIESFSFGILLTTFSSLFFDPSGLFNLSIPHAERARWLGVAFAIAPLAQFVSAGFLGRFSDQFGRKKWLLISIAGIAFSMLLLIFSILFKIFFLLLLSRLITGLFTGYVAIAQAAIADMSSTKSKVEQFNYMELSLGLGMLLGPLAGSMLLSYYHSIVLPYELNLALMLILFFIFIFFFKEPSLQFHCKLKPNIKMAQAINKKIIILLIAWAIFMFGWTMYLKFFTNFLQEAQHFNFLKIGHTYVFMGLIYLACQIFIVRRLAKKIEAKKWTAPCMLGVGVCMVWMGVSHSTPMLYLALTAYLFVMALFLPSFHAWLSDEANPEDQGSIFGVSVSLHALMGIFSGLLGGELLVFSSRFILYGAGIFIFLSFIFIYCVKNKNSAESVSY